MRFELVRSEPVSTEEVRWESIRSFNADSSYSCSLFREEDDWVLYVTDNLSDYVDVVKGGSKEEVISKARRKTLHDYVLLDDVETVNGEPVSNVILRKMEEKGLIKRGSGRG